jgi:predicted nucleotidyltransferase
MTADTKAAVERAVQELRACGAQEVYLFGSASNGRARRTSDLDLAVRGLPRRWFYRAVGRVMRAAGRPVDLVDLDCATPISIHLLEQGGFVRVG